MLQPKTEIKENKIQQEKKRLDVDEKNIVETKRIRKQKERLNL